jgi:hypothetical protein
VLKWDLVFWSWVILNRLPHSRWYQGLSNSRRC